MCKLKKILNQTMSINLYYSLIYSRIVYCIQAWGNAGVTDLNHIIILQKRSVRLYAFLYAFLTSKLPHQSWYKIEV